MTDTQTTSGKSKKRSRSAEQQLNAENGSTSDLGTTGGKHRHSAERYELVEIHRSQIIEAGYNPRYITEDARKRLKNAIAKVGLLAPITWNRQTQRIIGGHQRLRALDVINGNRNYTLRVAAVDMDEEEEKAANLLLNNPEAQGEWDLEKLGEMLQAPDLDLIIAGFDASDVFKIVGDQATDTVLLEIAERVEKVKAARGDTAKHNDTTHSSHWFLVAVFRDDDERLAFTQKLGLPNNRYVDGRQLLAAIQTPQPAPQETEDAAADADEEDLKDCTEDELLEALADPELDADLRAIIEDEMKRRGA